MDNFLSRFDAASAVGFKLMAAGSVTAGGSGVAGKMAEQMTGDTALAERVITLADIGIVIGILVGILGYATQFYFHQRRDRREQQLLAAELAELAEDDA